MLEFFKSLGAGLAVIIAILWVGFCIFCLINGSLAPWSTNEAADSGYVDMPLWLYHVGIAPVYALLVLCIFMIGSGIRHGF